MSKAAMKELFRERDLTQVAFYQVLLEGRGIPTFIRNENLSSTEGVSIPDFFPALCVVNDGDYDAAVGLIRQHLIEIGQQSSVEVACAECGESSPGNFETCWSCSAILPC